VKPIEVTLRCKHIKPLREIQDIIERHSGRWRFSRPYFDEKKFHWEIYVTESPPRPPAQQLKLIKEGNNA
jgi:hypothetical protein